MDNCLFEFKLKKFINVVQFYAVFPPNISCLQGVLAMTNRELVKVSLALLVRASMVSLQRPLKFHTSLAQNLENPQSADCLKHNI